MRINCQWRPLAPPPPKKKKRRETHLVLLLSSCYSICLSTRLFSLSIVSTVAQYFYFLIKFIASYASKLQPEKIQWYWEPVGLRFSDPSPYLSYLTQNPGSFPGCESKTLFICVSLKYIYYYVVMWN